MFGLSKKVATAVMAAAVVVTSFVPSQAIQMPSAPQVEKSSPVENVQYRRYYGGGYYRPGYYPRYRPAYRPGWYGGYRGYSYYRPGYRHYNGYWYPLAAFGVEGGTTGSIGTQPARPMQRQTYCQNTFGGTNGDGSMPCDNGY